jgi:beta-lactamase class A
MRYLLAALLFSISLTATAAGPNANAQEFRAQISALEKQNTGRIGVAVTWADGKPLFTYRGDERFAMCSTFKALLGAAILARVDAKQESLDRSIPYQSSDILEHAPIAKKNLEVGHMTVSELNAASIQYSDNTAANLLLDTIGGPKSLTDYLRSVGDKTTRLDRNEPSLNSNIAGDVRDTTTPDAMAATLQKLLIGDSLSPASKEQLKAWMFGNTTGDTRLRAGFDKFWMVGDKTGGGSNGANNDVAIVYPRGYPPFIVTVYYSGSSASVEAKNATIAEVARITSSLLPKTGRQRP